MSTREYAFFYELYIVNLLTSARDIMPLTLHQMLINLGDQVPDFLDGLTYLPD